MKEFLASAYPNVSKTLQNATQFHKLVSSSPGVCEQLVQVACRSVKEPSKPESITKSVKSPLLAFFNSCRRRDTILDIVQGKISKEYWSRIKVEFSRFPLAEVSAITTSVKFDCQSSFPKRPGRHASQQRRALQQEAPTSADGRTLCTVRSVPGESVACSVDVHLHTVDDADGTELQRAGDTMVPATIAADLRRHGAQRQLASLPSGGVQHNARSIGRSMWFNGSRCINFQKEKDDMIVPLALPSPTSEGVQVLFRGLQGWSGPKEDAWVALLDGFARDKGIVPPALVQKIPHRHYNRMARLTQDAFMTHFRIEKETSIQMLQICKTQWLRASGYEWDAGLQIYQCDEIQLVVLTSLGAPGFTLPPEPPTEGCMEDIIQNDHWSNSAIQMRLFFFKFKRLTGKKHPGATHPIVRKLPYLFQFQSRGPNTEGTLELIRTAYMMPTIEFGARICGDFPFGILCTRMRFVESLEETNELEFVCAEHEPHAKDRWSSVQALLLQGVQHGSREVVELDLYLNKFVCKTCVGAGHVAKVIVHKMTFEWVDGECHDESIWYWDRLRITGTDDAFCFAVVDSGPAAKTTAEESSGDEWMTSKAE